jgi:hypothetical protein
VDFLLSGYLGRLPGHPKRRHPAGILVNLRSGTCPDDSNVSLTNGIRLQIRTCHGIRQNWSLP